jgi:hypothetical protein
MEGRKGFRLIIETVVFEIIVLMVLLFFVARSNDMPVNVGLLVTIFVLLIPFEISAVFFLGRYIEKHGYLWKDVKRLYIILEEN